MIKLPKRGRYLITIAFVKNMYVLTERDFYYKDGALVLRPFRKVVERWNYKFRKGGWRNACAKRFLPDQVWYETEKITHGMRVTDYLVRKMYDSEEIFKDIDEVEEWANKKLGFSDKPTWSEKTMARLGFHPIDVSRAMIQYTQNINP